MLTYIFRHRRAVAQSLPSTSEMRTITFSVFLNMIQAPMGRFQWNQNLELVSNPGRARVETSTSNKTSRRCNNNERPTGKNTTIECDDGEN